MKENMMPSPEQLKKIQDENMSEEQINQSSSREHVDQWRKDDLYEFKCRIDKQLRKLSGVVDENEEVFASELDELKKYHTPDAYPAESTYDKSRVQLDRVKKVHDALAELKKALDSVK